MSSDSSAAPLVDGFCDARFTAVRDAFTGNFAARDEVGASICLFVGGRPVVDLWGGWADPARARPWKRDTLVNFFSVGKGLAAICALLLVQRGRLDLDAPVADVWPRFAGAGKGGVTLRHILSHQAGLPAIRAPIEDGAMLDWGRMTAALEDQAPWWPPGTAHGYHVNTYGYLVGEVVRRAAGMTLGAYLKTEIAGPLGADVHIGLPQSELGRVADFLWPANSLGAPDPDRLAALSDDELMKFNAYSNPPGVSGSGWVNRPEWRMGEIPSTNGHGTARGVAEIYAALARGAILAPEVLGAAATEQVYGQDRILERPSRSGLGFQLTQVERPLGPNPGAFGHFGAGGSLGFTDPEAELAFGYVGNHMGPRWQNPRNRALLEAIYASL